MTALETRLDTILPTLATKADVEALRADMEKADLAINGKFGAKFEELRADMEKAELRMNAKFDAGFDSMRAEMHKTNADIKTWALATMIAIIGTVLAGFIGLSQFYRSAATPPRTAPINLTILGAEAPASRWFL
ncbi:MAG: hypothetical protein ABWY27_14380 [Telluria sp.]